MHARHCAILLLSLCIAASARADKVAAQEPGSLTIASPPTQGQIQPTPAVPQRLAFAGPCSAVITPDQVVVVVGFSASGLKAAEVGARLDETAKLIGKKAAELGGKATFKDRLRGARNVTLRNDKAEQSPYTAVQLVDIEFPVSTKIERAVDALIPLGLDRFGRDIQLEPASSTQPFVFYRVKEPSKNITNAFDTCLREVLASTCVNALQPLCELPREKVLQCARIDFGSMQAEFHNGRNRTTVGIESPQRSPRSLESSGPGGLQFSGNASFSVATACVKS